MIGMIYIMMLTVLIAFLCILLNYKPIPCIAKKSDKDIITFVYVRKKYAKYLIEDKRNLVDIEVEF